MKKLISLTIKEFLELKRDKLTFFSIIFVPSLLLFVYGYAISLDLKELKLIIYDGDKSNLSREFIKSLDSIEYFKLIKVIENFNEIDDYIQNGRATAALAIYPKFSKKLKANKIANVLIILDGSNAQSSQGALYYLNGIINHYQNKFQKEILQKYSFKIGRIDMRARIWYNPLLESSRYLIPGLIAFVLMMVAVIITSLSLVKEKEVGTIEHLIISPLSPKEIVVGKIIPYFFLSLLASSLMIKVAEIFFHLPFIGSLFLLLIAIILFLLAALGLGLFISAISDTQEIAFTISIFTSLLPTMLLSNFIFPINSMPKIIQWITTIIPAKYFIEITRSIMLKGTSFSLIWKDYLALFIFCIVFISAGIAKISKGGLITYK